jgi:hypothetical protein
MAPLTLSEWLRIGEFLIVLVTSLVLIARWTQKVEHREPPVAQNGLDHRVRGVEQDVRQIKEMCANQKERLDEIHGKMSDVGNKAQKFIGEATDRFVSIRECDRRHLGDR